MTMTTDQLRERVPPVSRIEMLDYSTGFRQPADPVWRVEVSGYCTDFDTETAANNFRDAILALLSPSPRGEEGGLAYVAAEGAPVSLKGDTPLHTMTLTLTEDEMRALEALSKRADLPRDRVYRQALRTYQLVAMGHSRLVDVEADTRQAPVSGSGLTPPAGWRLVPEEPTDEAGCAEREVGRFVYNRIEKLMDAKASTPEGVELAYLAQIVSDVEEYGADGTEAAEASPSDTGAAGTGLDRAGEG